LLHSVKADLTVQDDRSDGWRPGGWEIRSPGGRPAVSNWISVELYPVGAIAIAYWLGRPTSVHWARQSVVSRTHGIDETNDAKRFLT
jgi:hypothetical protein